MPIKQAELKSEADCLCVSQITARVESKVPAVTCSKMHPLKSVLVASFKYLKKFILQDNMGELFEVQYPEII